MKYHQFILCLLLAGGFVSCKKQDNFLNEKPITSLSTISSLTDCQNILNNEGIFNSYDAPVLGENSTDDYYITSAGWFSQLEPYEQNTYIFSSVIFSVQDDPADWTQPYQEIYNANTVLDALPTIKVNNTQSQLYNTLRGTALFYRSIAFYNLVQTFSLPYDSSTASTSLGIPLRLTSNLNTKSVRATIKQCYDQVINDLIVCKDFLPASAQYLTRPTKTAVYALLARVYLATKNYKSAFLYSDSALSINSQLSDYNNITSDSLDLVFAQASQYPLPEVIYTSTLNGGPGGRINLGIVDSTLYSLYDSTDLRKSLFFANFLGATRFIGSYEFYNVYAFAGLATDELYLIRAESNARLGNLVAALSDLNALLIKRYKTNTFVPRTGTTLDDVLGQILLERRKELCFRGLRWTDMRRLESDPKYAITVTHIVNGVTYTLPPNDPRYAFPFPENEISLSGMPQNNR